MTERKTKRPTDADLRNAAYENGARPGSDLWKILVELQRRRDREVEKPRGSRRRGSGGPSRIKPSPL